MNQKDEEKLVMQYFREICHGFPKGKLIHSESPDFILKVNPKKSIGIELTRLDNNSDSLNEKIEATLQNKSDKIRLYQQKKFSAIWLIIYTEFIEESKSYNIRNKLNKWEFLLEFDKVVLFDLFNKNIFELI
jgi:hypothetical protein